MIAPLERAGSPARRSLFRHSAFKLARAIVLAFCTYGVLYTFAGENFHQVVPHEVYRSAQLSPGQLDRRIARHNIQTVINLRGCCNPAPWYLDQTAVVQKHGISQEDVAFSALRLPNVSELKELLVVLKGAKRPILIHCAQGADRTGLASAIVRLLQPGSSLRTAKNELTPLTGHVPWGKPAAMLQFLGLYEKWLTTSGREHDPSAFEHWAEHEYKGGDLRAADWEFKRLPGKLTSREPVSYLVRVRNSGETAWRMSRHSIAGFHLGGIVETSEGVIVRAALGCFRDATIAPGDWLEATIVVPSLGTPGRYRIFFDLIGPDGTSFHQRTSTASLVEEIWLRE